LSPNRLKHRSEHSKEHQARTLLELEWRTALGQSPNPWLPSPSTDDRGTMTVMQIVSRRGMSKLERRSLE
jgi:hypothetical protein